MPSIRFLNLHVRYGPRTVFRDFSLELEAKTDGKTRIFGLMGPSGSGKSTLLRLLLDPTERPYKGQVLIEPASLVLSFVPQTPALFEDRSILENARYLEYAGAHRARFNESAFQDLAKRLGMLRLLQSSTAVDRLSGGEKQRLMLLRALSIRPNLLLLDEPCSGLDPKLRQEFLTTLTDVVRTEELVILYVSHHWGEISLLCEKIAYLDNAGEGAATSRAFLSEAVAFARRPPTVDAARFVCEPQLNLVPVRRVSATEFESSKERIPDSHMIAFPIVPMAFILSLGLRPEAVSSGSLYETVKLEATNSLLTVLRERAPDGQIAAGGGLDPSVWVYEASGNLIGQARLSVSKRNDISCLHATLLS